MQGKEHTSKHLAEADIEKFMWVPKKEISVYMPSLFNKVKEYLQIA